MKKNLSFLFFSLLLVSCTVYKEYPIEIYKPGDISLPENVQNIVLVSRNFKYATDTLQDYYKVDFKLQKDRFRTPEAVDSFAAKAALGGLATELRNSGKFKNVEPLPYNLIKPHRGNKLPVFDMGVAFNISEQTKSDLLISLETLSFFYSSFSSAAAQGQPSSEVITAAVWCVIDPTLKKVIDRKQMIDTVYWTDYDEETGKKMELPPRIEAINMACELAGKNFGKRLVPSWQKTSRMYVLPPVEDFRLAAQYFTRGEWDNAIKIWSVYTPEKYGKLSIAAMYNTALALEMDDNIGGALDWVHKAEKLATSLRSTEDLKMVALYKNVLKKRKDELSGIGQQIPSP